MAEDYTVSEGDCINSIAFENGFFWETLWNHSSNADLKSKRKDPNVLEEGDVVHIPDITLKQESGATEQKHTFKKKGVPGKLNLQFVFDGDPRANVPYTIVIDGVSTDGSTDGDGWVRMSIPPNAQGGTITLKPAAGAPEIFPLQLGSLAPIDSVAGQKARLVNLGYYSGDVDDDAGPDFIAGISAFQTACGLTVTGDADDSTQQELKSQHGS